MKPNPLFERYKQHIGHEIEVVGYGDPIENVAIECLDCGEVIADQNSEEEES